MKKKHVLVLCPHSSRKGGVEHYNSLIKKHFYSENVSLEFYYTGKNYSHRLHRIRLYKIPFDVFSLIKIYPQFDLIVLNPSLDPISIIRDGVFQFIAKRIFRKKTLVVFQGWNIRFERIIGRYGKKIFRSLLDFDKSLVQAKSFKKTLISWGFEKNKIILETSVYEYKEFETEKDPLKIVFLSRFVKGKGCLEAIQTVELLKREFPSIKLFMVGEGKLVDELKKYVIKNNLSQNVEFTGWLGGDKKHYLLSRCGIMLYPSNYGEGMPNSIMEGMGMGLAIVTRPIAGIPDIIVDGENGYLVESLNPSDFADKIKFLVRNKGVWQTMSDLSKRQADERFEVKNVVKRLEKLYYEMAI